MADSIAETQDRQRFAKWYNVGEPLTLDEGQELDKLGRSFLKDLRRAVEALGVPPQYYRLDGAIIHFVLTPSTVLMSVDDQNMMAGFAWIPIQICERVPEDIPASFHSKNLLESHHHKNPMVFTFPAGGLEAWGTLPDEDKRRVLETWARPVAEGIMKTRGQWMTVNHDNRVTAAGTGNIIQIQSPNASATANVTVPQSADSLFDTLRSLGFSVADIAELSKKAREDNSKDNKPGSGVQEWLKARASKVAAKISEAALLSLLTQAWTWVVALATTLGR